MKVAYRYEDKDGIGPYISKYNKIPNFQKRNIHTDDKHPVLVKDCDERQYFHYSACPTIKDLRNWFRGYNSKLNRNEFYVVEIKVKDEGYLLGKSGIQARIDKRKIISKKVLK